MLAVTPSSCKEPYFRRCIDHAWVQASLKETRLTYKISPTGLVSSLHRSIYFQNVLPTKIRFLGAGTRVALAQLRLMRPSRISVLPPAITTRFVVVWNKPGKSSFRGKHSRRKATTPVVELAGFEPASNTCSLHRLGSFHAHFRPLHALSIPISPMRRLSPGQTAKTW